MKTHLDSITEYEKSTVTPKENEERYRALFNSSFELVYLHDLKGNFIDANPTALKLLGYNKEELGSLNFSSLLDRGQIWKAMKALNEIKKYGRQKEPTEFRLKIKNGTFIDVETTAEIVYRDGKPYAIQGIARDITERKQAQKILKESVDKYRTLFEATPDLIVETDEKGILLAVNPAMAGHFGIPAEKLIGKNIFDILPKDVTEERAKIARKAFKDGEIKINEDENAGRRFHNIYVPIVHPDGRKTLQLVARDITAAKKTEEALIENQEKYRLITENTNDLIIITNFDKTFRYVSPSIKSLGYTPDELVGQDSFFVLHPDDKISISSMLKQLVTGLYKPGTSSRFEYRLRDKSGVYHIYEATAKLVKDKSGKHAILSTSRDITERKKAEEKIKIFSDAIASAFDCFMLTDLKGNITYANESAINTFGYTLEEFLKLNITELDSDPTVVKKVMQDMTVKERWSGEVINIRKNKEKFPAILSAFIIKDDKDNPIGAMGIVKDITERKRVEDALRASEEKFRLLFNDSPLGIALVDPEGIIKEVNNSILQLLSIKKEEFIGRDFVQLISAFGLNIQEQTSDFKNRIVGKPSKREITFLSKDNKKVTITVHSSVIKSSDEIIGVLFILEDITEIKQATEDLRESETLLNDVGEMAHVGGWELDIKTKQVHWTKETYRIHDISIDEKFDLSKAVLFFDLSNRPNLEVALQRCIETGGSFDLVLPFTSAKGRHLWTRAIGRAVKNDRGKVVKLIGTFQDITERKKTEDALRLSEDKLRKVIDSSPDNITVSDLNGTIIDCNQATIDMHGFSKKEDIIGKNALELIALKDHERAMKNLKKSLEVGSVKNVEYTFLKKDGSEFPVEMSASVIKDPSGIPISFMGVIKDVSERKKVEQLLKESEEKFRTIFDNSTEGILLADMENKKFFTGNKTICNMLGYSVEEIKNLGVMEIHPKEDLPFVVEQFEKQARRESVLAENIPIKRKDGSIFYAEINSVPMTLAGKTYLVGTFRDITERKRAETVLKESEEKLRSIVENSSDQIFMLDKDYKFLSINKTAADLSRKSPQEMIGRSIFEIFPENIAAQFSKNIKNVFDTGKSMFIEEKMVVQGREFYNSTSLNPVKDDRGRVIAVTGIVRDITERKQSEEAIRESEERHRILFESSQDAIMTLEPPSWNFTSGNPATIKMFKAKNAEEFISNGPGDLSPERQPDGRASAEKAKEMIETAMREGSCFFEWTHKRLDGTDFPATVLLTRMEIKGKQFLQATVRDITEQKQTEKEREKILLWQQGVNTLQQSLLAPAPLEDKLKTITDNVVRLFDADFCRIWLTQPGDLCEQGCIHAEVHEGPHVCRYRDRCLRLRASSGRYTHTDGKIHRRVPFGCYKIGRVASGEDHKFLTNDVQNDPRVHNNDWARELGLVSFAGYQLRPPGGETIGVLALFAKHPIQQAEDTILDGLSSTVARVVQQAVADETLRESTRKIETQNVQLQKLDKIKSDFLNITSHELRTPMSAIKGYTQMVLNGNLGPVTDEQQHALMSSAKYRPSG